MERISHNQLQTIAEMVERNTGFPLTVTFPGGTPVAARVRADSDGEIIAEGTYTQAAEELLAWERGWAMARKYRHEAKHGTTVRPRGIPLVAE